MIHMKHNIFQSQQVFETVDGKLVKKPRNHKINRSWSHDKKNIMQNINLMNGHCGKEKKKTIVWNEFKKIKNSCKNAKRK